MKICFGTIPLNDGCQPPKSFEVATKNSVSALFAIGAENALTRQNKNAKTTIEFEIERSHASDDEAAQFAMAHAASLNALSAPSTTFADDANGAVFLQLGGSVLNYVRTRVENMSTSTKYSITGNII